MTARAADSRRYNRQDGDDAIRAARVCARQDGRAYYVFATYYGFTVHPRPPASIAQAHVIAHADGRSISRTYDFDAMQQTDRVLT